MEEAVTSTTELQSFARSASMRSRILRVFQDEDIFWNVCAWTVGAVALLKGLRWPNSWAATQAQFSYDHGFVKRGLFGTMVTRPLHLEHYMRFAVFSTVLLFALMAVLVAFTRWSQANRRVTPMAATAVFFSSYAITYLGHLNGYFDIVLAMFAIALICIRSPMLRLAVGVPVVVIALMVHELFLLVFLPVVLLSFVLNAAMEKDARRAKLVLVCGLLLAIVAGGTTLAIAKRPSLTMEQGERAYMEVRQRLDFEPQHDFFRVLTRSGSDNVRMMLPFVRKASWWMDHLGGAVTVLPTVALLLWLVHRMLDRESRSRRRWVFAACIVAAAMPLSMNALGFDVGRWYAEAELMTFLVYGMVCRYVQGPNVNLGPATLRLVVLIIALNMASGDGFIDPGATIKAFPYTSEIKSSVKDLMLQHR